jgi:hypothetical protein
VPKSAFQGTETPSFASDAGTLRPRRFRTIGADARFPEGTPPGRIRQKHKAARGTPKPRSARMGPTASPGWNRAHDNTNGRPDTRPGPHRNDGRTRRAPAEQKGIPLRAGTDRPPPGTMPPSRQASASVRVSCRPLSPKRVGLSMRRSQPRASKTPPSRTHPPATRRAGAKRKFFIAKPHPMPAA